MQASLNARIDAEVAKLDAKIADLDARLSKAVADGDAALQAQITANRAEALTAMEQLHARITNVHNHLQSQVDALDARITAVSNAQGGTVNLPPS